MPASSDLRPVRYGRYLLLDRISVGGMAEVFRGKTAGVEGFERLVALKRILPAIAADPDFVEMFVDEAKLAVQLQHANISQIYDLGRAEGTYYIAMEYISGVDLRKMWDRARNRNRLLPIAMSCHIMQQVCEGLDAAHRKKDADGQDISLVHRDVSPQNVMVSFEGEVKVIDFGIARAANKVSKTQAGVLKGKFGYMSPEQVRGMDLDNRSDVFACGAVLYELLVGDRLFLGESDFATLEKVRNVDVVPPTRLNKNLSPHLERIVMKALAKNREDRYRWASEMAEDLQRYLFQSNQPFARTDLQRYMQQHFQKDIEEERERRERYRALKLDEASLDLVVDEPDETLDEPPKERIPSYVGVRAPSAASGGTASLRPPPPDEEVTPIDGLPPVPPLPPGPLPDGSGEPAASHGLPAWAGVLIGGLLVSLVGLLALAWSGLLFGPGAGTLSIVTEPPQAKIWLDGELVANKTPYTLEKLDPKTYQLRVQAEGYEEVIRAIRISGDSRMETIRLTRAPGSASLVVRSEPQDGLRIFVDGKDTGQRTPATIKGLSGDVQISLLRDDDSVVHRHKMVLADGAREALTVELEKLPTEIELDSEPSGAEVLLNKRRAGTTPLILHDLKGRSVRLELRKQGCKKLKKRVPLRKATVMQLNLPLRCP